MKTGQGQGAAEQRVAEKLRQLGTAVLGMQMIDLAQACGTSQATVVRCCRHMGYAGLKEYKIAVARGRSSVPENENTCLDDGDCLAAMRGKLFTGCRAVLSETETLLGEREPEAAVQAIGAARNVDIYAYGGSAPLASYLRHKLMMLGIRSSVYSDRNAMQLSHTGLGARDVVIAISASGGTANVTEALGEARRLGARTIALTTDARSPIAKAADICLLTAGRAFLADDNSTYTRLAQLAVIDLLYAGLAFRAGEDENK